MARGRRLPRAGFDALVRAKRLSSQHLSLSVAPTKSGGCAVVVSKKVAPRSVDRHLIKRRILSVLMPLCKPDTALVVYAKAGSARLPFSTLKQELLALLGKLEQTT